MEILTKDEKGLIFLDLGAWEDAVTATEFKKLWERAEATMRRRYRLGAARRDDLCILFNILHDYAEMADREPKKKVRR